MSSPAFKDRRELEAAQLAALRHLVAGLVAGNAFYRPRLEAAGLAEGPSSLAEWSARMSFTTKAEIVDDQARDSPWGTNLTYPLERYVRFHQTSGTTGQPLRWLDTAESWAWMLDAWERVFRETGVEPGEAIFFPFSFGPFLGFWTAFDAASRLGATAIPGGGLGSRERLELVVETGATTLCLTPTYALRLGEVAAAEGIDLGASGVRRLIVAGEPGGGIAATRERISALWGGARVFDHHGMTEVGPVSFPNAEHPGVLHVVESSYLAEVLDPATIDAEHPETARPVEPGERGELVLTTLGRLGSPLLRYRTGDLVEPSKRSPAELGHLELALEGGILARTDDMVVVRGVNLYPSAVERVIRAESEVEEFRVELEEAAGMLEMRVVAEPRPGAGEGLSSRLEEALRRAFHLRVPVELAAAGSLPRFEMKARRWIRR